MTIELESVKFHQAVRVGDRSENFLSVTEKPLKHPGIKLFFKDGFIVVKTDKMPHPKCVPLANVPEFVPIADFMAGEKAEKPSKK